MRIGMLRGGRFRRRDLEISCFFNFVLVGRVDCGFGLGLHGVGLSIPVLIHALLISSQAIHIFTETGNVNANAGFPRKKQIYSCLLLG